jgi:ArsR family transcriptional regulator, arsenate/arsenite/antimonite-responsive transcriptional repressor
MVPAISLYLDITIWRHGEGGGAMEEVLRIFKAAADPTRLRILRMLSAKPLCVCEVMHVLGMAQSTTSRHLTLLLNAGLVEALPGGTWTVYRVAAAEKGSAAASVLDAVRRIPLNDAAKRDLAAAKGADRSRLCRQRIERRMRKG